MLGLVVATNIFQMYIFWELVGASSYLLIGFYYTRPAAIAASKKAFIVTRFADLGFLIGILILSYFTGTFDFGLLTADDASLAVTFAGRQLVPRPVRRHVGDGAALHGRRRQVGHVPAPHLAA